MEILMEYGMVPNLFHLFANYWKQQRILPESVKFLGKDFGTGKGMTLGDPPSTMIFNIVVDVVVREVLDVVCGPQEAQHGLGWVSGEKNMVFYAKDGRIAGQDHEWV